ncbi:hypothetical protein Tco_0195140 [Tanacetum coccineum]
MLCPSAEKTDSSLKGLKFYLVPLLEEYYNQHTDQAEKTTMIKHRMHLFRSEFVSNLFVHGYKKVGESHPLEHVHEIQLSPVQTRRQLCHSDLECRMFALTEAVYVAQPERVHDPDHSDKGLPTRKAIVWIKASSRASTMKLSNLPDVQSFSKADVKVAKIALAMTSAAAVYVALSAVVLKLLWNEDTSQDYASNSTKYYSCIATLSQTIAISCNQYKHSQTKHIHTRTFHKETG